jgi:hypothetical protein
MSINTNNTENAQRRPNIFIASSSEAKGVAKAVKRQFERFGDVDYWEENMFLVNQGALENLVNLSAFYDFAVAIFTKDDQAQIRDQSVHVTRDNVIFEFGLFLGRLGPSRAFFIAEEGVKIFSDWDGISRVEFKTRANLDAAVGSACDLIEKAMKRAEKKQTFTLLPSTAIAFGYYDNFLARLLEFFRSNEKVKLYKTDSKGCEIPDTVRYIETANRKFVINVEIPAKLEKLESTGVYDTTDEFTQVMIDTTSRPYPFYINTDNDTENNEGDLNLFDIPTTLLASRRAIEGVFSEDFLLTGDNETNEEIIERREIENFKKTLEIIAKKRSQSNYFRFRIWHGQPGVYYPGD